MAQARRFYIDFFEKNILSSNIQSIFILILFLIISVIASRLIVRLLQNEPSEKIKTISLRNFSLSLLFIFFFRISFYLDSCSNRSLSRLASKSQTMVYASISFFCRNTFGDYLNFKPFNSLKKYGNNA